MTEANINLAMLKNYLYVLVHIRDNWLCIDCSENILEQQVCQNVVLRNLHVGLLIIGNVF